ncbi:MAG TPA: PilZ domain-containing protein [Candidatus Acidoferrales bacterium]|jgi:PilZ domain-containing protein|nr:PilZ domain-containing protein [Candidatus Acidoferrales bacterium]
MPLAERRRENRVMLQIPFQFRSLAKPTDPTRKAVTQNISPRGIYFTTSVPFVVGAEAEVTLEFPRVITGREPSPMRCTARVMHVEQAKNGIETGVGLYFERIEPAQVYVSPAVKTRAGAAGMI